MKPHLRGKTEIVDITGLQPNSWNGNVVPDETMASIARGFETDGWLVSLALTVWRTDETGAEQNIIIDGEHRWLCALDTGLHEGPVVFLDGLTRKDAKALTYKLYKRRGAWAPESEAELLAELSEASEAVDFGIAEEAWDAMVAEVAEAEGRPPPEPPKSKPPRPPKSPPVASFCILIECANEPDQVAKLKECQGKGWKCRALI